MARSGVGHSARASLALKEVNVIGVDCAAGEQRVQWSELREGFPVSYVKTDGGPNSLIIEFPSDLDNGTLGASYKIDVPDGNAEFAVVDGAIRKLSDNHLEETWTTTKRGLVQKADQSDVELDQDLPWDVGTLLSDELGMTPDATRRLVDANYAIRKNTVFNVGPSATSDFANLNDAYDFLNTKVLLNGTIVTLQLEAGDIVHTQPVRIYHPQGIRIRIYGASLTNLAPEHSSFTGDEVTDRATLRSWASTRLVFSGSSGGLYISTGCRDIRDLLVEGFNSTGSGIFVGYDGEYSAGASAILRNVAVHGFPSNGITVTRKSNVDVRNRLVVSHNGSYGVFASFGANFHGGSEKALHLVYNGSYNLYALYGSTIYAASLASVGGRGIIAHSNSRVTCAGVNNLVSGSNYYGLIAGYSAQISFIGLIKDCAQSVVYAYYQSAITAPNSTFENSAGSRAVYANSCSFVYCHNCTLAASGSQNVTAGDGSFVRIDSLIGSPVLSPPANSLGNHNSYIRA
jgi:hypothetical protein